MKIVEDEIIGELRYLTVKFDRIELMAGGVGVISQGAVRRYFEKKSSDLKVKKCGGLKLDSQKDIVTMRFGVVNQPIVKDKCRSEKHLESDNCPNFYGYCRCNEVEQQKFLNPGYDEILLKNKKLKEKYDTLKRNYDEMVKTLSFATYYNKELEKQFAELKKLNDGLKRQLELGATVYEELQEKYDALVAAVSKDAQKFSDLLTENEELKKKYDALKQAKEELHDGYDRVVEGAYKDDKEFAELEKKYDALVRAIDPDPDADDTKIDEANLSPVDKEAIRIGEDALQIFPTTEDIDDLADVKEVIVKDDSIDLDVFEEGGESENV